MGGSTNLVPAFHIPLIGFKKHTTPFHHSVRLFEMRMSSDIKDNLGQLIMFVHLNQGVPEGHLHIPKDNVV